MYRAPVKEIRFVLDELIGTEGLRACVSLTGADRYRDLEERVRAFQVDHPAGV